ncbi:MAG: hypothetical protein WC003_01490 [Terrimicrobiaceae bacterium]
MNIKIISMACCAVAVLSACVTVPQNTEFNTLSDELATLVRRFYPEAKIKQTRSLFLAEFGATKARAQTAPGKPWITSDMIMGEGFMLCVQLEEKITKERLETGKASNGHVITGYAPLSQSGQAVSIWFIYGFKDAGDFPKSVLSTLRRQP